MKLLILLLHFLILYGMQKIDDHSKNLQEELKNKKLEEYESCLSLKFKAPYLNLNCNKIIGLNFEEKNINRIYNKKIIHPIKDSYKTKIIKFLNDFKKNKN